jgi:hypothetical protein
MKGEAAMPIAELARWVFQPNSVGSLLDHPAHGML